MPEILPLFPLGTVLFPGARLHLHVFEARYRLLVRRTIDRNPMFGVVLIRRGNEVGDEPEIFDIGTSVSLRHVVRHQDGTFDLELVGQRRFRVLEQWWQEGSLAANIEWLLPPEVNGDAASLESLDTAVRQEFLAYIKTWERLAGRSTGAVALSSDSISMAFAVSAMLPLDLRARQELLETDSLAGFLQALLRTLQQERRLLESTGVGGTRAAPQVSRFSIN